MDGQADVRHRLNALVIAMAAERTGSTGWDAARTYRAVGDALKLDALLAELLDAPGDDHWRTMERDALSDDLLMQHLKSYRTPVRAW